MATEYSFYIFPLSENELPEVPITRESFENGLSELISKKLDEKVVLQGLSRSDWVRWTFKRLFEVCHENCLTFLIEEWVILKPEQVQTTAHDLRLFSQRLQSHPEIFQEATGYRCEADIAHSYLCAKPTLDPEDGGDGDSVFYLVQWLISAIELLEKAEKKSTLCDKFASYGFLVIFDLLRFNAAHNAHQSQKYKYSFHRTYKSVGLFVRCV